MQPFKFDFDAIKGKTYEDGFVALMQQLEDHYNENINVRPNFVFGADPATPGGDRSVETVHQGGQLVSSTPLPTDLIRMAPDWEIKDGQSLGLKEGRILTGVSTDGKEIFDFLVDYADGDQIATGESGKYDLGRA